MLWKLKMVKESTANIIEGAKAKRKVWFVFLEAKRWQGRYD